MRPDLPSELDQPSVAAVAINSQLAFGSVGNTVVPGSDPDFSCGY